MRKYLKFFGFPALVALTFSMPQKTQGMDSSTEYLDENLSGSPGILHFERGTYDLLNQKIIDHDRICSQNHEEKKSLIESAPLIKGSAILIKEAVRYTLDHPIQTALIGLSCQLGVVNAFVDEEFKYGTAVAAAVLQGVSMICEGVATYNHDITNTTQFNLNAAKYGISWVALVFAGLTGWIVYHYDQGKTYDKVKK